MNRLFVWCSACWASLLFCSVVQAEIVLGVSKQEADLEVGCMYPLTGASALWGNDAVVALEMALDEIHALPASPKMRVYVADTMGKQFRSREIALNLVSRGVDVLCGVVNSNIALEVTQLAKKHQLLFLGAGHSTARLTEDERHPWYFHLNNDASQSSDAGARYLRDVKAQLDWKTISYIGPDYEYGHQIWQTMMASLKRHQVEYQIKDEFYSLLGQTDYRLYIDALLADPPDVLVSGHWTRDLVSFLEQASVAGLLDKTVFVNFDTGGGYFVLSRLGDTLPEGVVLSGRSHVNWPTTTRNRNYINEFFNRTQRFPTFIAQDAYTVVKVLDAAWQQAQPQNLVGLRNALPGLEVALPEDPEGFHSYIDAATHKIMQYQAIGTTQQADGFRPATRMLGEWQVYPPTQNLRQHVLAK
ncbi:ABC transporter substrate-binding protein [Vibrio sp. 404]|uniref:ABC transporter substrate-binding protein n=1 Tax=Vibrio marinisediminis TaxID=2758441 RepID=A0A7W2FRT2_9VIBR|nr:ABC transporter substrate-binding protein [Vibrio marinisediminis]MBA5763080.1 ABC transporter substrate-binding protein [Vibrio marinisediminis]